MNSNSKLSYAIAAILSGGAAGLSRRTRPSADSSDQIAAITVTAQRRTENIQDVPISIQALTAETLKQLNVTTFDDYVKYLPNVTAPTNGPGQSNIFMRGLSVGAAGSQSSGTIGGFPNVAIYLDDQSGQLPARNLDIYAADLERIEILEGPQGTLFGAGAQAGVDPLHHQQAEARRDRGERRSRLRRDRARRPEHRPDGGAQPAADRRHAGGARA